MSALHWFFDLPGIHWFFEHQLGYPVAILLLAIVCLRLSREVMGRSRQ